jgi:hypothetical protein
VTNSLAILRTLFALLICGGLCRQDWSLIHHDNAPEHRSTEQTFEDATYGQELIFREAFEASTGARSQHSATSVFVFDFPEGNEAPAPALVALGSLSDEQPKARSHRSDCLRNKDPPSSRGQGLRFSVNASTTHFNLSSYDTPFFALRAHRFRISIDGLFAHTEPGSEHHGASQTG